MARERAIGLPAFQSPPWRARALSSFADPDEFRHSATILAPMAEFPLTFRHRTAHDGGMKRRVERGRNVWGQSGHDVYRWLRDLGWMPREAFAIVRDHRMSGRRLADIVRQAQGLTSGDAQ